MSKKSVILAVSIFAGALVFAGCSNDASDEEMAQLSKLRSEISSLEQQVSQKQQEKSGLQQQIADRDAKLKQCQADQDEAKRVLGK